MPEYKKIQLSTPSIDELSETVKILREWQHDDQEVIQLHPGDLGWFERFGPEETINAIRRWNRDDQIVAIGLMDGPNLLRLAINPDAQNDEQLAQQMAQDIAQPESGIFPTGPADIETRSGNLLRDKLESKGWTSSVPWTSLKHSFEPEKPVDIKLLEEKGLHIEVTTPEKAHVRTNVQRAAFKNSTFEEKNWHAMATGLAYSDEKAGARCLVLYDKDDKAVAAATVWSAGKGKPGLIEPLGVGEDHRSKGYGTAITLAAAAELEKMGSSSATVCTESSNIAAVKTYEKAGFKQLPEVKDLHRSK